jgi:hypothetical protein
MTAIVHSPQELYGNPMSSTEAQAYADAAYRVQNLPQLLTIRQEELEISLHEVSRQSGVNVMTLSRFLRDKQQVAWDTIIKLLRWLEATS